MGNTYGWDSEFKAGDKVLFMGKIKGKVLADYQDLYAWQVPVELKGTDRISFLNSELLTKR